MNRISTNRPIEPIINVKPAEHRDTAEFIARSYLSLLKTKVACQSRIHKLEERGALNTTGAAIIREHFEVLKKELDFLRRKSGSLVIGAALTKWCARTRGLGTVARLTFSGYIDPLKCPTVGKLWAYLGFTPNGKLRSGEQANFNPELKGRFKMVFENTIYQAKKEYYANRPDLKAQENTRRGWKGMIDGKARYWLDKIIISHAVEVMRGELGLSIPLHHPHIPPKPASATQRQKALRSLLPKIRRGRRAIEGRETIKVSKAIQPRETINASKAKRLRETTSPSKANVKRETIGESNRQER